tara:strand:+ start:22591 stop:22884 length:294 start_codon:yes stop_codon:yes gene_type:complete
MKVKVTSTHDIAEIPELVDGMVSGCKADLRKLAGQINVDLDDVSTTIKNLEEAAARVSVLESKIVDIINIATGWYKAVNEEVAEESVISNAGTEQDA